MLSWVEIDGQTLANNLQGFRRIVPSARLGPVVKANAYGHGLVLAGRAFAEAGANWLCVNAAFEAHALRLAGIELPIYILGYVPPTDMDLLASLGDIHLVAYQEETLLAASQAAASAGTTLYLHLKLETGNNRQGVQVQEALALAEQGTGLPGIVMEGVTSHYADIEDTTDHSFAKDQLRRFEQVVEVLNARDMAPAIRSFSNSAATLLWNSTHFDLVRIGIAAYGMWPSKETLLTAEQLGRDKPLLKPAMTWKTRVAQVKWVPPDGSVGYGRSWRAGRRTRLAVLPVGYYEGYVRSLSNLAYVLVNGQRAPVRGRVCMNMTMVDVTDIDGVETGSEVVLLGEQGSQTITAEQLATWSGTINYEVTTRIHEGLPRILV